MNASISRIMAGMKTFDARRNLKAVGHEVYKIENVVRRHQKVLEERMKGVIAQVVMLLVVLPLAWEGTEIVNMIWEDFFVYPYLIWEYPSITTLVNFWPLGLWCAVLLALGNNQVQSSHLDEKLLLSGLASGNLAGVWEEIGFRYVFICYAMLFLGLINWLLATWLAWLIVSGLAVVVVAVFVDDDHPKWVAVFYAVVFGAVAFVMTHDDPYIWLYQNTIMPVLDWMSFGSLGAIFQDTSRHQPLMVMGAIMANTWFRDGHKYQGIFGWLDSWVVGFVLMYAMFTYGLLTAITLHCCWNTAVYMSIYGKRKVLGRG